jgi:carboxylesterase
MKRNASYILLVLIVALMAACNTTPAIDDTMLDSGKYSYAIADSLQKHLISNHIPNPTELQKNTPVLIAAHGYTATTFEWDEFRNYADSAQTFYVSQVLLGGHGTSYTDFKSTSWEDWQASIKYEYVKLSNLGFRKIYLAGSSTGAPLIINLVKSGFFNNYTIPKGIFLIDPIIVSANKTLTMVGLLGPVLGYTTVELSAGEAHRWYIYRSQESLKQLMSLIDLTRRDLEKGIALPTGTYMKVYKSKIDDVADPVSAFMIYKGMKTSSGSKIDVDLLDSKIHVFTRLRGRDGITAADWRLQHKVFAEIEAKMKP